VLRILTPLTRSKKKNHCARVIKYFFQRYGYPFNGELGLRNI
jgi:hypothetical protein